ncbi:TIGR03751 family conjugal transfer lipoprotein [Vibrio sp. TBV020]|uniref:TIGR03751 family conjugal transfer lipoprotein n=1 Tax=Vibrio sp. TBV020 TaxID=3137398 RepID=UPI0038CD3A9D
MPYLNLLFASLFVMSAVGCSTVQDDTLPTPNTNVEKVWQQQMGQQGSIDSMGEAFAPLDAQQLAERQSDYARDSWREATNPFPRLPNPDIVMYVMPHKVGNLPIPGYTTVFPLYERVHYATPMQSPANLPKETW